MSLILHGIAVSRGVAIGTARLLRRNLLEIPEYSISKAKIASEHARFQNAINLASQQLRAVREQIPKSTTADIATFIDTHLLMLEDPTFTTAPLELISTQLCNAEWAIKMQRDAVVQVFEEMDDAYLRTRKDDIDHVVNLIQRVLLGKEHHENGLDKEKLESCILLADDLTPADTIVLQHRGVAAFITEYGGPLSHTAILARSLGIPAIVGAHKVQTYIRDGELLVIDGQQGVIIADADKNIIHHYREKQKQEKQHLKVLARLKTKPTITRDGCSILLHANIELPEDIDAVNKSGAQGVGLYRTEFLYMNRNDPPSEEEQLEAYMGVVKSLRGLPLTIRTLDLGADKEVDGGRPTGRICTNPALGLRAIRLCLKDLELFRPQLRAILRASGYGPVRLMIPMLSNLQEAIQVIDLINEAKCQLAREDHAFDADLPIGGMIEVPAAALAADYFSHHLDFLSIGTNDLIQYTLAIDRIDDEVNYLYDPTHPAVLQLIYQVITAGNKAKIPVSLCGEMAGDTRYTRLLLGLGLREFSMQSSYLLEVKRVINISDAASLERLARKFLRSKQLDRREMVLSQLLADPD